jgi:hypothetical protein
MNTSFFKVAEEADGFMAMEIQVGANVYIRQGNGLVVGSHEQARQLAIGILARIGSSEKLQS